MTVSAERRPDWPEILSRMVKDARGRPFVWGSHDCCVWACRVIDALTGAAGSGGIAGIFEGTYDSKNTALRRIVDYGAGHGGGLEGAARRIAEQFGGAEIAPLTMQRGDCALVEVIDEDQDTLPGLGICIGAQIAMPGREGLVFLPLKSARLAWRV